MDAKPQQQSADFRHIVRIVNTDVDGNKKAIDAVRKIPGVGFMFANMVFKLSGVNPGKRAGNLSDDELGKLDSVIKDPLKYGAPIWMINRRKDIEDGLDKHISSTDIKYYLDNDLKRMKMIRCYKGVRHMLGQPVRGQRTRSNFRKNKGKGLGVQKKKVMPAAAPAETKGKEKK